MRASALLAALLLLGLTGCLQAVQLGAPDGNAVAGQDATVWGPDGSLPPADASNATLDGSIVVPPDAGAACKGAGECPPPVQTDPVCTPLRATCSDGRCGTERVPRIWDGKPGACLKPEDCDCQGLTPPKCVGSWLCTANQCAFQCGGCTDDLQCPMGQVCQEVSCGSPKQCIDGCRDGAGCPAGTLCDQFVMGKCGEAYGQCLPEPGCSDDTECPKGSVCDFSLSSAGKKTCQTGCRDATGCDTGEDCVYDVCMECMNCPCHGHCQGKAACKSDSECAGTGEICASDWMSCTPHCLVGCRTDADCRADQVCPPLLPCDGCGCDHQTCQPRPVGCTDSGQCPSGQICVADDSFKCDGEKHCREGCLSDDDCDGGQVCELYDCGPCCPGRCAQPPGCADDASCPEGTVCEPGPGCTGEKSCVPGCRVGKKACPNGATCSARACVTCPCPDVCEGVPVCPPNGETCKTTLDCSWGSSHCDATSACCQFCPVYDVAPCPEGKCMWGTGVGLDGCALGPTCGACCICPAISDPVCGTNYQTYQSSCEATCAGATILHAGECKPFEGMGCDWGNGVCAAGQYCRDACPMCDMGYFRCTLVGACEYDFDCPAGAPMPSCSDPNQRPVFKCESTHACSYTCQ